MASAPCMFCPEVTWLWSLGGEVATCGLHPVDEMGEGGPEMVLVTGLKLQRAVWHRGGRWGDVNHSPVLMVAPG